MVMAMHTSTGPAEYCGAMWPNNWISAFVDGLKASGVDSPVQLSRAGWAGFQTTGAVLWSSDIPSTFESLQVQIRAGKWQEFAPAKQLVWVSGGSLLLGVSYESCTAVKEIMEEC